MHMHKSLAALVAVSLLSSTLASAEDARITCTGTVTAIFGSGLAGTPFVNAAVGETITIVVDAEIARQLPFGDYLYQVNTPTSSISIGAASDGLEFSAFTSFGMRNNLVNVGDFIGMDVRLESDPASRVLLSLVDSSGTALDSQDVRDFYGTSINLADFTPSALMYGESGQLQFELDSVSIEAAPGGLIGTPYCTAAPNSTGSIGTTTAYGRQTVGDNDITLTASGLPLQSFGYFLVSADQGFVVGAGGSDGNLCLGGAIGRFVGENQVMQTDFGGEIALPIYLTELPTPTGSVMVQAGQTWNFQLWNRDSGASGQTSNFTQGLSVTFQ